MSWKEYKDFVELPLRSVFVVRNPDRTFWTFWRPRLAFVTGYFIEFRYRGGPAVAAVEGGFVFIRASGPVEIHGLNVTRQTRLSPT